MNLKSITLTQNASLVLSFGSPEDRDSALDKLRSSLPREVHSKLRSGVAGDSHVLTIRVQDITHPVTITLDDGAPSVAEVANMDITSGRETFNRLKSLPRDQVPGANADAHTEERPTTSGINLMQGVPGAVNNDPSTATNAAYEGSPAQAVDSLAGEGLGARNTVTPGGFNGPDKAAVVKGAAGGGNTALPGPKAETLHPEGQQQDAGAVNVNKAAVQDEKDAKAKAREARLAERAAKEAKIADESAKRSAEAAGGKTESANDLDGADEKSGKAGDAKPEESKLV